MQLLIFPKKIWGQQLPFKFQKQLLNLFGSLALLRAEILNSSGGCCVFTLTLAVAVVI